MIAALRDRAAAAGSLRATLLAVLLVHAAGTFLYMTVWRTVTAPDFDVNDFKAYYAGALALSEGRPDLLYPDPSTLNLGVLPDQPWVRFAVERGVPTPSGYIYPPFLAVVLRPLTALPYHRANQVWFVLNGLLFALSVTMLATWRRAGNDPVAAAGVVFVALTLYPTMRAFQCGQVSLVILFLTACALWLLARGRDASAGVAVALAAALKLTPAILAVYFLLAGRRRAVAGFLAGGAGAALVSIAGAGWAAHETFLGGMLPALSRGAATFANQSLPGLLARLGTGATMNAFEFVDEPAWLRALSRGLSAVVLVASLWVARRLAARGDAPAGLGLVVLGSLVASPISWEHHYVAALVPVAVLIARATDARGGVGPVGAAALAIGVALLSANAYDLVRHHFPYRAGRIAIAFALYGALLLWGLIASGALAARRGGSDAAAEAA